MPKPSFFPTIIDECPALPTSFLKHLKPGGFREGSLHWYRGETETGAMDYSAFASADARHAQIRLDYISKGRSITSRIQLEAVPSNLGKGVIWFFTCPVTNKRCRKLHFVDGYFVHRSHLTDAFYAQQTYSAHTLRLKRLVDAFFIPYHTNEEIEARYFKKSYKGKTTRRYGRLLRQIKKVRNYSKLRLL